MPFQNKHANSNPAAAASDLWDAVKISHPPDSSYEQPAGGLASAFMSRDSTTSLSRESFPQLRHSATPSLMLMSSGKRGLPQMGQMLGSDMTAIITAKE